MCQRPSNGLQFARATRTKCNELLREFDISYVLVLISNFFFKGLYPGGGGIMKGSIAHVLALIHTLDIITNFITEYYGVRHIDFHCR